MLKWDLNKSEQKGQKCIKKNDPPELECDV